MPKDWWRGLHVYFSFKMWRPLVSERSKHEQVTHFLSRFESRSVLLAFWISNLCAYHSCYFECIYSIKIAIRYNLTNLQQLQFQNMITIELIFSWHRPEAACCLYRASATLHLYKRSIRTPNCLTTFVKGAVNTNLKIRFVAHITTTMSSVTKHMIPSLLPTASQPRTRDTWWSFARQHYTRQRPIPYPSTTLKANESPNTSNVYNASTLASSFHSTNSLCSANECEKDLSHAFISLILFSKSSTDSK